MSAQAEPLMGILDLVPDLWWVRARAFMVGALVGALAMFAALVAAR